jgi:hypothetical protein
MIARIRKNKETSKRGVKIKKNPKAFAKPKYINTLLVSKTGIKSYYC